jgi:hypothetical protein
MNGWLAVWNIWILFFHIFIIPTDFHIFRGDDFIYLVLMVTSLVFMVILMVILA